MKLMKTPKTKEATRWALMQPSQKEILKAKKWKWFTDAQTVSTIAPPRRLWSGSISPTSFDFVASVLPMRFYFILMSNPWCRNIACSAHKCMWCERRTFLDLLYMPNSESMPRISITPLKHLHPESRDGPTWAEELSARRGKVHFPQHFPCLNQITRHDNRPARPGISLPDAGSTSALFLDGSRGIILKRVLLVASPLWHTAATSQVI